MRELSDESVSDQAEAFLSFWDRVPSPGLVDTSRLFEWWCAGKDFGSEDRDAIRDAVQARLLRRSA